MTRVGFSPSGVTGTQDVDIRTVGGSTVGDTIPISGTVDIVSSLSVSGTLDVDIKTLGGSVVPFGKLPVDATCSTVHCDQIGTWDVDIGAAGTLDVDIKTLGGSVVPAGPLPVDIGSTGTVEIGSWEAGTLDVDIKTIGGSVVPSGKLPVDATCSTVHADQVGTWDVNLLSPSTLDVDIKTIGGSVVASGNLPVDATFAGTMDVDIKTIGGSVVASGNLPVDATFTGTMDVDIKTIGGSVVASGNLPVDATFAGTADVDIKTVGGEVVPVTDTDDVSTSTRVVPTMGLNYTYDSAEGDWDRMRSAVAWPGGTYSPGEGVQDVAIVGRYGNDASATLHAIVVDVSGNMNVTGFSGLYVDFDSRTQHAFCQDPLAAGMYALNEVADNWDRVRTTESMVASTMSNTGLLAIGEFGYDGSAWRYKAVDASGYTLVSGTLSYSPTGTQDVDIKTLGGSVVPAGPLPVDIGAAGTLDVDIKTLGGSVVPAGPLPVDATFAGTMDVDIKTIGGSVVPAGDLPVSVAQANIYGYDGSAWDALKTTDAIAAGTIDEGLLGMGLVERNHYCPTAPFTSTTFAAAGTLVCSSAIDISRFFTKTICHYVLGSASTLQIWARCCPTGTMRNYYQDTNVTASEFVTKSFTEALHDAYVCVEVASAVGTIWTNFAMQS